MSPGNVQNVCYVLTPFKKVVELVSVMPALHIGNIYCLYTYIASQLLTQFPANVPGEAESCQSF